MKSLAEIVQLNRRFARSARIDADLSGTPPLVGYVLQASVAKALTTLAENQRDSHQGAFTWTGPYGGGKSSAALLVANLVAGAEPNRSIARDLAGEELTRLFNEAFPEKTGPWSVIAVTGSRVSLREAIAAAAAQTFGWKGKAAQQCRESDEALISSIMKSAGARRSGALLILDELGKLLEHEATHGGDIHLLQDLAEQASRSEGQLVVVGILHQSFDQYAARAARDARKEWAKVQGRFLDVPFLSGPDEVVALLGQAITCERRPKNSRALAADTARAVAKRRPTDVELLTEALSKTWPLNPVTALLLGPVSRQRFAQNERSLFGFLSSAEPNGFREFLTAATGEDTYGPARLWDYLAANFGMSLAGGSDGGRFSLAFEAIERAGAKGGSLHVELTKSAAVIEFFRNGSGLALADDVLAAALPHVEVSKLDRAITDLLDWAILIRQPRLGGYALFAGSDFDLEEAIGRTVGHVDAATLASIPARVGCGFATAKKHYFQRGALRTFDIRLEVVGDDQTPSQIAERLMGTNPEGRGSLVLLLSDGGLSSAALDRVAKKVARDLPTHAVIGVGAAADSYVLRSAAAELIGVERVFREHPQLEGDRIARREIAARQSECIDQIHRQLERALDHTRWWLSPDPARPVTGSIASVASKLADAGFPQAPILHSELLQRDRASSNAIAALRELCHAMVERPNEPNLGVSGFPAELGLYLTVIQPFGLHGEREGQWDFHDPDDTQQGRSLQAAWNVLKDADAIGLDELFEIWHSTPFGLKSGVMPALALAYLMAHRDRTAVYIDEVFQTALDDVFVDKLLQKPSAVRFRRIDRSLREAAFLGGLAQLLGVEHQGASLPVAQALFQRFEALSAYSRRTATISEGAQVVRTTVLKASDPEALLFEQLPHALGDRLTPELVYESILECEAAYPKLLDEMRSALARSLGVSADGFDGTAERAETVKGLTNDLTFDAFAIRAAAFEVGTGDIEGLISLLLHKPATSWTDRDRDQALLELAKYGRRFRELEALASIRDRRSHTEALAVVVGVDPRIPPLLQSFELTDREKKRAAVLAEHLLQALCEQGGEQHLQLAALARAIALVAASDATKAEAA